MSPSIRQKVIAAAAKSTVERHSLVATGWIEWLTEPEQWTVYNRLCREISWLAYDFGFEVMFPHVVKHAATSIKKAIVVSVLNHLLDPSEAFTIDELSILVHFQTMIPGSQLEAVVTAIINRFHHLNTQFNAATISALFMLKPMFDKANVMLSLRQYIENTIAGCRQIVNGVNDEKISILYRISQHREMVSPEDVPFIINLLRENIESHDRPDFIVLIECSVNFLKKWGPTLPDLQREAVYYTLFNFLKTPDEFNQDYRNMIKLYLLVDLYQWPNCPAQDREFIRTEIKRQFVAFLEQTTFHASPKTLEKIIRSNTDMLSHLINKALLSYEERYCVALDRLSDLFIQSQLQSFIEPIVNGHEFDANSWPVLRKWMTASQRRLCADRKVLSILSSIGSQYRDGPYRHITQLINQIGILDDASPVLRLKVLYLMNDFNLGTDDCYIILFIQKFIDRHNASLTRECLRAIPIGHQRHLLNDLAETIVPMPGKP